MRASIFFLTSCAIGALILANALVIAPDEPFIAWPSIGGLSWLLAMVLKLWVFGPEAFECPPELMDDTAGEEAIIHAIRTARRRRDGSVQLFGDN